MSKAKVQVAIAVLYSKHQVLVGWREAHQHQGNKHEFPGGKVEQDETPLEACRREILEEVGIVVQHLKPLHLITHEYDDLIVELHIYDAWLNDSQCDQVKAPWSWYARNELNSLNFPKANAEIIQKIEWAPFIKISPVWDDLKTLDPLCYLYLRTELMDGIIQQIEQSTPEQKSRLIVNFSVWEKLSSIIQHQIAAIHIKQHQLLPLAEINSTLRYIAACHDKESISKAQQLGIQSILLSPILETMTHPKSQTLGWEGLKNLSVGFEGLVYALGGLGKKDLAKAQQHGAYGIAGISQF